MSIQKPRAILCDVNGTLFGLDALGERMTEVGLPKSALAVSGCAGVGFPYRWSECSDLT